VVRWYDYLAAILVADFILANAMIAAFAEAFWMQLLAAIAVTFLYDAWTNMYCAFRLNQEKRWKK
jgi:hypothetical protein